MPKTHVRKRSSAKGSAAQNPRTSQSIELNNTDMQIASGRTETPSRQASAHPSQRIPPRRGGQGLLTAGCVALGCWGFAFSFVFTTSDPNRYTYGGMAAVLALVWSILFALRLRKSLQQRYT
jgi:hypothetical protein